MDKSKLILVTGATGYIASRLIPRLLERGYRVRCLARNPDRLIARAWCSSVDVVAGDVMDPSTLPPVLDGVDIAYYLIHNMSSGSGYTSREQNAAQNFAQAAEQAGVKHIIYLGGLADPEQKIPYHMRSRIDTGETLRESAVPVTEFRAGVIVGPGSISFEMIRFMTELMPIIFGPVWLQNRAQPIAAQNVIDYLLAGIENESGTDRIFEIGGPDVMSYADLMLTYAHLRGLRRKYVVVPGIPLRFMALGVEWMTPVPAVIAIPLVDGMRSESVMQDDAALDEFPTVNLIGYENAVEQALSYLHPEKLEPTWMDYEQTMKFAKHEGFFIDHRCEKITVTPEKVFQIIAAMGGKNGWLYADWLWKLRGMIDRLIGGVGLRGRSPKLKVGDVVDYYRVDALEHDHLLRLYSELKAPGEGWMEWRIDPFNGGTRLVQNAFFAPRGIFGFVYWWLLGPVHRLVFRGLLKKIKKTALDST